RPRAERRCRRGRVFVPDRDVDAELARDALQVAKGEVEAEPVRTELFNRLRRDHELDLAELPASAQDRVVVLREEVAGLEEVELVEEGPMRVEEGLVAPGVRRPDLEGRSVRGDAADLVEDERLRREVLETVRREDGGDAPVGEREPIALEVDDVIDARARFAIDTDVALPLRSAAADVDPEHAPVIYDRLDRGATGVFCLQRGLSRRPPARLLVARRDFGICWIPRFAG